MEGWISRQVSFFSLRSCNAGQQVYLDIMCQPCCASFDALGSLVWYPPLIASSLQHCISGVVLECDIFDRATFYGSNVFSGHGLLFSDVLATRPEN